MSNEAFQEARTHAPGHLQNPGLEEAINAGMHVVGAAMVFEPEGGCGPWCVNEQCKVHFGRLQTTTPGLCVKLFAASASSTWRGEWDSCEHELPVNDAVTLSACELEKMRDGHLVSMETTTTASGGHFYFIMPLEPRTAAKGKARSGPFDAGGGGCSPKRRCL